eukprot:223413_1
MAKHYPTRNEFKCAGVSFIIANILILIAAFLFAIDYDIYDVHTEEQVIKLHNLLSSSVHRTEVEIAVALVWISYPLLLISICTITKIGWIHFEGTSAETIVYLMEKSYLMFITVCAIILPALSLSSISFEWSFHEYTAEPDVIPTGYYIQLYIIVFIFELIDCIAIADATFMITTFILPRYVYIVPANSKIQQYKTIMESGSKPQSRLCGEIIIIFFILTFFIIFCIILFEFAESGFFSPTGPAKLLVIWSFICKLIIGLRLVVIGASKKHEEIRRIFEDDNQERMLSSTPMDRIYDQTNQVDDVAQ